jgi:hypothetical protein
MIGGIPIYPGGYSCVFKPQLKCKTKKNTKRNRNSVISNSRNRSYSQNKGISKLLFKKYAEIEMQNIEKFHDALRKIPKSHKYFLFTKSKSCSPAKISLRDLKGFNEMCTNFTSHDVNESNINSPSTIHDLKLINMPDAGISMNEWLFPTTNVDADKNTVKSLNITRIKIFNNIISKLILNAIVPMNRQGVIHNDMKEDNILIKDIKETSVPFSRKHQRHRSHPHPHPTIIDWGISGISTHDEPIPEIIMNRYISISNPFSSVLFTTEFSKHYSDFLKKNEINDIQTLRNNSAFRQKLHLFSTSHYLKHKEYGHYSHIQTFFKRVFDLFSNDFSLLLPSHLSQNLLQSPTDLYNMLVSNYISDILLHFTEFDERDQMLRFQYTLYFTKVYIFNCDIWGIMFCYSVFFSFQDINKYRKYVDIHSSTYLSFLRNILSIYMNQIMVHGHEKINITKLIKSITTINHNL